MCSQNKIQHAVLVFIGLAIAALIEYGTKKDAYWEEQRIFIEGLCFEEIVLLDIDHEQAKCLAEINIEYYDDMLSAYYKNSTKQAFEEDIQSLLIERHNRILKLLNEDQKGVWKTLNKLIDQIQECGKVHGPL